MTDSNQLLQVHTGKEVMDVTVPEEVRKALAAIVRNVQWSEGLEVKVYFEGAVRSLSALGEAAVRQEGETLYSGQGFADGLLASRNARSIAQFLYRNGFFGDFMPCVEGTDQLFTTKLKSVDGTEYALQLFPSRTGGNADVLLELWSDTELEL